MLIQEMIYGEIMSLHYACLNNASMDIIGAFIKACPDAMREKNAHGSLPLHIFCWKNAQFEVVDTLQKAYADAI